VVHRIPRDVVKNLKKVNWTKVWHLKKINREDMMTEELHQLVKEFEEKMSVIFQQLVKEADDLKNEVRDLNRTCDMLRAEKTALKTENLRLKNGILHSIETMRDSLASIVEGEEGEEKEAGKEGVGAFS
jgi:septal ring factor EnvC (AmiA/AmiB activator)